ncbi:MAG: ScpA family protein [Pseudomonadota bacterium]
MAEVVHPDFGSARTGAVGADGAREAASFVVDLKGFEGPIDLLLALARTQKVDLTEISIVALVDQYAEFIAEARAQRLELAADYLVMAAWLAYLKSRLLLPEPVDDEGPDPEEMAEALAARLRKLDALRTASGKLWQRPQKNVALFPTAHVRSVHKTVEADYSCDLYDLLDSYGALQTRRLNQSVTVARREVWSLSDARALVEKALGSLAEWTPFEVVLAAQAASSGRTDPPRRGGKKASAFAASLELVREGTAQLRQQGAGAPLFLRAAPNSAPRDAGRGAS